MDIDPPVRARLRAPGLPEVRQPDNHALITGLEPASRPVRPGEGARDDDRHDASRRLAVRNGATSEVPGGRSRIAWTSAARRLWPASKMRSSLAGKQLKIVLRETSAADAFSAIVTASKPRTPKSSIAAAAIAYRTLDR
jgi:hypothetical protein